MQFGLKFVWHPTPEKAKSVADAILWGMGTGGLVASFANYPKVGATLAVVGTLAKCVSNFCYEPPKQNDSCN